MMRRRTVAAFGSLVLALVAFACGQIQVVRDTAGVTDARLAPKNMGFEAGVAANGVPIEWDETGDDAHPRLVAIDVLPPGRLRNYSFERDTKVRRSGKASGRLRFDGKSSARWAATIQCIDASPELAGRTAKMRGYMKIAGVKRVEPISDGDRPGAGMYLRSDTPSEVGVQIDNMDDRALVGTIDWKRYEVKIRIDAGVVNLCFGLILNGVGSLWVDDLELTVR